MNNLPAPDLAPIKLPHTPAQIAPLPKFISADSVTHRRTNPCARPAGRQNFAIVVYASAHLVDRYDIATRSLLGSADSDTLSLLRATSNRVPSLDHVAISQNPSKHTLTFRSYRKPTRTQHIRALRIPSGLHFTTNAELAGSHSCACHVRLAAGDARPVSAIVSNSPQKGDAIGASAEAFDGQ